MSASLEYEHNPQGYAPELLAALPGDARGELIDELIEAVASGPDLAAMDALGFLGESRALGVLEVRCFHPEPILAAAARRACARLTGEDAAVVLLGELLGRLHGPALHASVACLAEFGVAARPGLLLALGAPDAASRGLALEALTRRLSLPPDALRAPSLLPRLRVLLGVPLECVWRPAAESARRLLEALGEGRLDPARVIAAEGGAALLAFADAVEAADSPLGAADLLALSGDERAWAEAMLLARLVVLDSRVPPLLVEARLDGFAVAVAEVASWPGLPAERRAELADAAEALTA
jgi:hypothetical protein